MINKKLEVSDKKECYRKRMLKRMLNRYPIIKKLKKSRVFGINCDAESIWIYELCDEYFCHVVNKNDVIQLSKFFKELSRRME
jgi:hypothetical protein|nr:MAG TPA: hypothetical protein [Caudoviricetes sp.]